ncbi:MAG: aminoacyl-tRNA hydrolase [Clostridia bacterium]|nr:aminoacyl-tRNA hydrolase [Clostridia bacterium]
MANIFELLKRITAKDTSPAEPVSWLIVGLGNPGAKYHLTRHNTGFLTMDYLSQKFDCKITRSKFQALCGDAVISGKHVLMMKPQTMMNNSGNAVREAAAFYKIPAEHILVIFDDISLDPGRIRVRGKGTDGGHNGIKSIIYQLQADTFPRIKVGIGGKPSPDYSLIDWVLSPFTKDEQQILFDSFSTIAQGVELILQDKLDAAQQLCNSYNGSPAKEDHGQ